MKKNIEYDLSGVDEILASEAESQADLNSKIASDFDEGLEVQKYVDENKGVKGFVKVAAGQFADEFLGGIPELAADLTMSPVEKAKKDALKEEFSTTNTIAGLAGFGASLVTPAGPLSLANRLATKAGTKAATKVSTQLAKAGVSETSKSLAKQLTAKSIANATKFGVEGAVMSAPYAITEATLGDLDLAAETMTWGTGLSALVGMGIPLSKAIGKGLKDVASPLVKNTANSAANSMNIRTNPMEASLDVLGITATKARKIPAGLKEDIPEFLNEKVKNGIFDDANKLRDGVELVKEQSGELIGNTIDNLAKKSGGQVITLNDEIMQTLERVQKDIVDDLMLGETNFAGRNALENYMTDFKLRVNRGDFTDKPLEYYSDLRKSVDKSIDYNKLATQDVKNLNSAKFYIRETLENAFEKMATDIDPALAKQYRLAKRDYQMSSMILDKSLFPERKGKLMPLLQIGLGGAFGGGPGAVLASVITGNSDVANKLVIKYGKNLNSASKSLLDTGKIINKRIDNAPFFSAGKKLVSEATKRPIVTYNAMRLLTGNESGSDLEQFNDLKEKVSQINSSPESIQQRLSIMNNPMVASAPDLTQKFNNQMMASMKYIEEIMPKAPEFKSDVFGNKPWQPSDSELNRFKQQLQVIVDPMSIFDMVDSKNLTKPQIDVLERLYPKLLTEIRSKFMNKLAENQFKGDYSQKAKLGLLLGIQTDSSLNPKRIAQYQNSFGQMINDNLPKNVQKTKPSKFEVSQNTNGGTSELMKRKS